jgi:hypothetical protein
LFSHDGLYTSQEVRLILGLKAFLDDIATAQIAAIFCGSSRKKEN